MFSRRNILATALMSAFAALAFGTAVTNAQTPDAAAASSTSTLQLSAVDDNFIAQANLGAPFQIASGPVSYTHLTLPTKRIV